MPEEELLLRALRDYVHGDATDVPADADASRLAQLCVRQQLSPVVYRQTRLPELQPAFVGACYRAANRRALLGRIHGAFSAHGVAYLVFKGSEIARYYPHPELRTSGDIDLLVCSGDKERAGRLLEGLGFAALRANVPDCDWIYEVDGFELELHHGLFYGADSTRGGRIGDVDALCAAFADTVWAHSTTRDGVCWHIEPEFHFVYLLLHLRQHFLWAGVGVRQFLDLAIMMRNVDLDYGAVGEYIARCGMERFSQVCFAFVERWFGVGCPLGAASVSEEFCRFSTRSILSGGAFGDMSWENRASNSAFKATQERGRAGALLAFVFPPWERMRSEYPEVARHKALLPLCWMRRIAAFLRRRSLGGGLFYAREYLSQGERERTRARQLDAWGL